MQSSPPIRGGNVGVTGEEKEEWLLFHPPGDRAPTGGIGIAAEDLPDFIYLIILFFQ
jgi:hypothetical protein